MSTGVKNDDPLVKRVQRPAFIKSHGHGRVTAERHYRGSGDMIRHRPLPSTTRALRPISAMSRLGPWVQLEHLEEASGFISTVQEAAQVFISLAERALDPPKKKGHLPIARAVKGSKNRQRLVMHTGDEPGPLSALKLRASHDFPERATMLGRRIYEAMTPEAQRDMQQWLVGQVWFAQKNQHKIGRAVLWLAKEVFGWERRKAAERAAEGAVRRTRISARVEEVIKRRANHRRRQQEQGKPEIP